MEKKIISILKEWLYTQKTIEKMVVGVDGCIILSNGGDDASILLKDLCHLNEKLNAHNVCVASIFSPSLLDETHTLTIYLDYVNNPERWDFDLGGNKNSWVLKK